MERLAGTSNSQKNDGQGEDKSYGEADELMWVYFSRRSLWVTEMNLGPESLLEALML